MAAILQMTFSNVFFNRFFCILNQISFNYVSKSPLDNKAALAQVMTWHQTGDKPLPELIITHIYTVISMTVYGVIRMQ